MKKPSIRLTPALCAAALAIGATVAGAEQLDMTQFDYLFKVKFTGYVGSTLTDFPALVKISEFNGSGFRYANCGADGSDLRFADAEGNLIPHEIDTWDPTGTSLVWVKVPSLDATTAITACYGYKGEDPIPAVTASDVWDNGYVAVWHLNAEETSPTQNDSTVNALTLTAATPDNILCVTGGVAGIVGSAAEFAKGSDGKHKGAYYHVDNDGTLSGFSAYTFELWSFQNNHAPADNNGAVYFSNCRYDHSDYAYKMQEYKGTDSRSGMSILHSYTNNASNSNQTYGDTGNIIPAANVWNYQAFAIDANSRRVFLNDSRIKNSSSGYPPLRNSAGAREDADVYFWLGNSHSGNHEAYPGKLDEVRISNVARSDDWVRATYDTVMADGFAQYEEAALRNDWNKYARKFTVTFKNYTGNSTLTNFPVLVKLSASALDGFSYADFKKPNGGDLRFSDEAGNILPSEVDCWDTNGISCVWVKVPELNANTKIRGYYGWAPAPDVDATAVWDSDYMAVWHLNAASDDTTQRDSTGNAITLTEFQPSHTRSVEPGVLGVVGSAARFGLQEQFTGSYYYEDSDGGLSGFSAFTLESWSYQEDHAPADAPRDSYYIHYRGASQKLYGMFEYNHNGKTIFIIYPDGSTYKDLYAEEDIEKPSPASWNYHAFSFNGSTGTRTGFLNGNNVVHSTDAQYQVTLPSFGGTLYVGNSKEWNGNAPSGNLDEVRISKVARSDDWIKATYDTIAGDLATIRPWNIPTRIIFR